MSIELIGLIFAGLGAAALLQSQSTTLLVFGIAALFQAASALAFGPANITPGNLVLMFLVAAVVARQRGLETAFAALVYPRPGFFLLVMTMWGVMTAFLMPRLFAGDVLVYPVAPNAVAAFIEAPLFPTASNMTQSVYLIGSLLTFLFVSSLVRSPQLLHRAGWMMLLVCAVNMGIAILDSITFAAGIPDALDFMRNADYGQAFEQRVAGMKRLTGSFTEASAFSAATVGLFAYSFRLWRGGVFAPYSGFIAIASFLGVILAFSTTGYVALAAYLMVVYGNNLMGVDRGIGRDLRTQYRRYVFIAFGPLAALVGAMLVAFRPDMLSPVQEIFDSSITTKLASESGQERMSWNMTGLQAFFETAGLGVGAGSIRTSSFVVSLIASLGIVGTVFFGLFMWNLFNTPNRRPHNAINRDLQHIVAASRSACFALFLSAALAIPTPDLGLIFYIFAGIACTAALNMTEADRVRAQLIAEHQSLEMAKASATAMRLRGPRPFGRPAS